MKPLKSCCCFDLRTGGLIIGCLGIIGIVIMWPQRIFLAVSRGGQSDYEAIITVILAAALFFEVVYIIGIRTNERGMIIPSIVLWIVGCILMLIPISAAIYATLEQIDEVISEKYPYTKGEAAIVISTPLVPAVIFTLITVLMVYFIVVKYYLYKEIKERNQRLPPNNLIPAGENGVVYKFSA